MSTPDDATARVSVDKSFASSVLSLAFSLRSIYSHGLYKLQCKHLQSFCAKRRAANMVSRHSGRGFLEALQATGGGKLRSRCKDRKRMRNRIGGVPIRDLYVDLVLESGLATRMDSSILQVVKYTSSTPKRSYLNLIIQI